MEIKSYSEIYLSDVSENIGSMLEYAMKLGYSLNLFWQCFINSNVSKQIENGNPKYLSGYSGKDYINLVLNKNVNINNHQEEVLSFNKYYWAGYAITQLQFKTGYSFNYINKYLPITRVLELYNTLHEADINKFFDVAKTYFVINKETNLKRIRLASSLSQSKLAKTANVDLRSIQMYEQRRNDINKAQAETLLKLSKTLGCRIEDLLE